MASSLPPLKRLLVSNQIPLPSSDGRTYTEPGVEVLVDSLEPVPIMPQLKRASVGTHTSIPSSNDGSGRELDAVPGSGIVIPGGANIYYLDFAPDTEVPMHRTPSTDYVIVLKGTLTVLSPPAPFEVADGKGLYTETAETIAHEGDVVVLRGAMHAMANRSAEWVRLIGIVLGATPSQLDGAGGKQELGELWLK